MHLLTGPWPARATWALLPLIAGPALGDALSEHSLAVARTASVLAWGTWMGVLIGVMLPRTVSLTALRIAAPAALVAANWAAVTGADPGGTDALAVTGAALTLVAAFSPLTGETFVNGSSYGDELRFPLRVPGALLFGPLVAAEVAVVTGTVAGPLLLAARQWVLGAAAVAVGLPLAFMAVRALHGLARRWVVLVPAGLVLHDHHALVEPVLFPRRSIRRLGPAAVDDGAAALDLTQRSFGLALVLELDEPTELSPRRPGGRAPVEAAARLLFTPTRPGGLLGAAAGRRLPVG